MKIKDIKLSFSCPENIGQMPDTENGKFCATCKKDVIDFREKDAAFLAETKRKNRGNLCGMFRKSQVAAGAGLLLLSLTQGVSAQDTKAPADSTEIVSEAPAQIEPVKENKAVVGTLKDRSCAPKGGYAVFYKKIEKHFKPKFKSRKGYVYVQYVVEKDGEIRDIKVVRGLGPAEDSFALEVMRKTFEAVPFIPAVRHGVLSPERKVISVAFRRRAGNINHRLPGRKTCLLSVFKTKSAGK